MNELIEFKRAIEFDRGVIYGLLRESYADLLDARPDLAEEYKANWKKADDDTFDNPNSIGRCVLISTLNNEPVGFVSWDPRCIPEVGEVGQNCILPAHRGKGLGKLQIQKVLDVFREKATRVVKVTTENHPFFVPAQRTYLSCGFREGRRSCTDAYGGLELMHFEFTSNQYLVSINSGR